MNTLETEALAIQLEVNLEVDTDTLELIASPKENITLKLRDAIQENRDDLIRALLYQRAFRFITEKIRHREDASPESYRAASLADDAYHHGTLEDLREMLSRWMKVAVEETGKFEGAA